MEDKNFELEISSQRNKPGESSIDGSSDMYIEVSIDNEVLTEIEVTPNNSFKAKYKIIAVGKIEQDVEIVARPLRESLTETELVSRALGINTKDTYLNVMYRGNSDVYTEIQPVGHNFLETEIEVPPNNSFKAKYKLIAVGRTEQDVEIVARPLRESLKETELISRALGINTKDTYLNVMYRGNSDVYTEIQPIGYNFLEAEIEVPPHNRMWAVYEVQQPPIVTDIFNPTQDSFTREELAYQSINYGKNSSMVVGRSQEDIWRSFVQFDLSSINHSYVLKESYLRLYYKGIVPNNIKLEILNADSAWQENNITNLNKPNPIDLISNKFTVNTEEGYIEFDVLEIVKDWVALEKINNGFIVRLSNETEFGQTTFYTRETIFPPKLVVKYFDSRIFSQGRSQHLTEIFAYRRKNSDKNTEITVDSVFSFRPINAEIYVHRKEVPLHFEELVEISASKPYVPTQIISAIRDEHKIPIEISARKSRDDDRYLAEIAVNRPSVLTEISSALRDTSIIDTIVAVTKPSINVEITVPTHDKNQVDTEIEINEMWTSVVYTEINVAKDKIPIEITPRVGRKNNLQTVIYISKPKIEVEVEVKHRNDIWVEIEPNIKSDVLTEIFVSKPNIEVSVTVQRYNDSGTDTEIYVKYTSDVLTVIDTKSVSQVETIIDIKKVSQVDTEITVSRRKVETEITIPTWIDHDVVAVIEPRILMVDNIFTVIQVGSKGGAYAFII
ncbi:DNRLRE domain-containing protein [Lysinibacillus sp. NPDC093692]|uniref:DNRLRE domain-containing protein n=1 Tax=Lysinibacillus sp. NPDC093692 TaxID=3390578 RepID=UPI003D03FBD3